jgi:hypothetical protein
VLLEDLSQNSEVLEGELYLCVQFLKFYIFLNNVRLHINIKEHYKVCISNNGIYGVMNVETINIF